MRKKYDFLKNMNRCILSFAEATKKASMKLYYNFVGIIKKVLSFFKKASMAIFIGLAITLHLIPIISSFYTGNSVEWLPAVGMCYPSNYPRLESSNYLRNNLQNQWG